MRKHFALVVSLVAPVLVLAALAGCGEGAVNADDGYYENRVYGIKEEVPLKNAVTGAIEYGQFGSEIAVAEVTVTNDIASPEANALLLTSEYDNEGDNASTPPASGNEFLMITFMYRKNGCEAIHNVLPSELKLANANGDSYPLVPTQGRGGIYNADIIPPGTQSYVTAVFEVPQKMSGLVLTYEQSGMVPIRFDVR